MMNMDVAIRNFSIGVTKVKPAYKAGVTVMLNAHASRSCITFICIHQNTARRALGQMDSRFQLFGQKNAVAFNPSQLFKRDN